MQKHNTTYKTQHTKHVNKNTQQNTNNNNNNNNNNNKQTPNKHATTQNYFKQYRN